jgi:hypothetical protein
VDRVEALFASQDGLATRAQLRSVGLSDGAIDYRCGPNGRWQTVLPGVVAAFTGEPSEHQRFTAAVLWAGPDALLGAGTAALLHGLRYLPAAAIARVHVLMPHQIRRSSTGFVSVRRAHTMPAGWTRDGLLVVPPARAVIDACRGITNLRDVRALIAESVQRGRTTVDHLHAELREGASAGSRLARVALSEVSAGTRSAPEAELRSGVRRAGLPEPLWNHNLYTPDGEWLAKPDGWWREGVALEADSQEWHLAPHLWERTMRRHERMASYGILVVHAPPSRIRRQLAELMSSVGRTLAIAASRPRPVVIALPAGTPFRRALG